MKSYKNKTKLIGTEDRLVAARGGACRVGKMGEGGKKIPTSHVGNLKVAKKAELKSSHCKNIFF